MSHRNRVGTNFGQHSAEGSALRRQARKRVLFRLETEISLGSKSSANDRESCGILRKPASRRTRKASVLARSTQVSLGGSTVEKVTRGRTRFPCTSGRTNPGCAAALPRKASPRRALIIRDMLYLSFFRFSRFSPSMRPVPEIDATFVQQPSRAQGIFLSEFVKQCRKPSH